MTLLTPHLPFPASSFPSLPPPSSHLLITSSLRSPADFCLAHVLGAGCKEGRSVVLVDLAGRGERHWRAMGKRMNWPMQDLVVVQPLSVPMSTAEVALFDERDDLDLLPLCNTIADLLAQSSPGKDTILVVDDLGKLLDLGAEADDVMRFVRALRVLTRKTPAILVTHLHTDALDHLAPSSITGGPEAWQRQSHLLEGLVRAGGGWWWRVGALASGRSGVVMGEISSHPLLPLPVSKSALNRDAADEQAAPAFGTLVPTAHPLQYRLSETGIEVFAKGTGRGFL